MARDYRLARRIEAIDPPNIVTKEELISLAEAAAVSGLHSAHLRKLAERGDLEARKIGRNWVTTSAAVKRYLADTVKRANDPKKRTR